MSKEEEKKLRLNSNSDLTILLDKVFKNVFNPSKNKKIRYVFEDDKSDVKTVVTFETLKDRLNQFDKCIFSIALSEQRAGNNFFSIRRLWQKIGGSHTLTAAMRKTVSDSVERLSCTRLTIDMSEVNSKNHYSDKEKVIFKNYLLPCKSVEFEINGQIFEGAYQFLDTSPLLEVAELKKQITKQPLELLNVPKLHNSELIIKLKFFLLERITAIIGSHKNHKPHIVGRKKDGKPIYKRAKKLQKIITFEDIFDQCELSDATKRQKQQTRETIKKVLEHFKDKKFISEWHFEKKNGVYYSIHFAF